MSHANRNTSRPLGRWWLLTEMVDDEGCNSLPGSHERLSTPATRPGLDARKQEREMSYTIGQDKLEKVVAIVNKQTDPAATEELVRSEICADWNEGEEHQEWIDTADAQEIADWLASFYR